MKNTLQSKVNWTTTLGTMFTYYDFIIFNIAVALVFPKLFFPGMGHLLPILAFAAGLFARPLGGLIFGIIGDKFGRKISLLSTLYITGISTVLIGLLPTYDQIGITATILLFIARIAQTTAVGGEWAASSTMIAEYNADSPRRGFFASFVNSVFGISNILAAALFLVSMKFADSLSFNDAWRIPFLISSLLLIIGVYIRKGVLETPEFTELKTQGSTVKTPVRTLLNSYFKKIISSSLAISLAPSWVFAVMVFGSSYMIQHQLIEKTTLMKLQLVSWIIVGGSMMVFGWISDRMSKVSLFIASSVISLIVTWPIISFISQGEALIAMLMLSVLIGPAMAAAPALFCDLYPTQVRQTGVGISYNLGMVIAGIVTLVAQKLSDVNIMYVAYVYLLLGALSLTSSLYLKKLIK